MYCKLILIPVVDSDYIFSDFTSANIQIYARVIFLCSRKPPAFTSLTTCILKTHENVPSDVT